VAAALPAIVGIGVTVITSRVVERRRLSREIVLLRLREKAIGTSITGGSITGGGITITHHPLSMLGQQVEHVQAIGQEVDFMETLLTESLLTDKRLTKLTEGEPEYVRRHLATARAELAAAELMYESWWRQALETGPAPSESRRSNVLPDLGLGGGASAGGGAHSTNRSTNRARRFIVEYIGNSDYR
jgi:hypothetical protein